MPEIEVDGEKDQTPTNINLNVAIPTRPRENQRGQLPQQFKISFAIPEPLKAEKDHNQPNYQNVKGSLPYSTSSDMNQEFFEIVRHSLRPFSDKLDPFAQLPITLDRFQEHLVTFYLLHYPKIIYGLSTRLRPSPVVTNFSIAINNPPNFQVALARAALYRLSLLQYANEQEKRELQIAFIYHKGEAIRLVRELSEQGEDPDHKDNMIAAVISLGTLYRREGVDGAASMHFVTVRRMLRSIGGPLGIRSVLLSRVMVHFEAIYGTNSESYVWAHDDTHSLLRGVNCFFEEIWEMWRQLCGQTPITPSSHSSHDLRNSGSPSTVKSTSSVPTLTFATFALQAESSIHEALSRPLEEENSNPTTQQLMGLIFQLNCILILCNVVLEFHHAPQLLKEYMSNLNSLVEDAQLDQLPCNNHLWLIQIHDQTTDHSRRTWRAASFGWLLKRVNYAKQKEIRQWMLAFLSGEEVARQPLMELNPFHFSYAS